MDKGSQILFILSLTLIVLSVCSLYFKTMVEEDFIILETEASFDE